jgi:hypothetical protein
MLAERGGLRFFILIANGFNLRLEVTHENHAAVCNILIVGEARMARQMGPAASVPLQQGGKCPLKSLRV